MDPARFRPVATALSLGLAVLLTGCSGGATAEVLGTPSATPSSAAASSAPAGPTAYEPATPEHPARNVPKPTLSEKAKENTEEGARVFLQYWAECVNYLVQTGDPGPLRSTLAADNHKYDKPMNSYAQDTKSGRWSAGTIQDIKIVENSFRKIDKYQGINVQLDRSAGVLYGKSGKIDEIAGDTSSGEVSTALLIRTSGQWKLRGFQTLSSLNGR